MANTEILLLQPVDKLGNEGEQVKVKAGYARNFLFPRKIALPVTRANRKQVQALQNSRDQRLARELANAEETAVMLRRTRVALAVRTGPGGKVFGSVTAQNLVDRLNEEGINVDKRMVHLYNPVKSLGKHETRIKIHPDVVVDFEWEVVSENPIQDENGEVIQQTESREEANPTA